MTDPLDIAQNEMDKAVKNFNNEARTEIAISLWNKFAPNHHIGWEDETHKADYLLAVDNITTGHLFNLLLSRIDFDGMDVKTFSLAELYNAIKGAKWPK